MDSSDTILISALQHVLFCPRQYALIHIEQVWAENRFTAEGQVMHQHAHDGKDESRPGVRIVRGLKIGSQKWGLSGVCDVVEFYGCKPHYSEIVPIEYKRGKPKAHRADEIQLCAQAVCLQEMTEVEIPKGYLFYGKTRRRAEVSFDQDLLELLRECIDRIRAIQESGKTPPPQYKPGKCDSCSLMELCQPNLKHRSSTHQWFMRYVSS